MPTRRRWLIVAIIFAAMMLNYIDRATLSFLEKEVRELFSLDEIGYAWVVNIFIGFYALMYPVTGWLVDRFGRGDGVRRLMFGGIVVWSLACAACAFARKVWVFGAFRALLGSAEPMAYTAQIRVVTEWFPKKLRATANSLCVAGGTIGMVIAAPFLVGIKETFDWRWAFVVPGLLGLGIAVIWFAVYRNPPEKLLAENIDVATTSSEPAFTFGRMLRTRTLWGVILTRFVSDPVWYFCLFWLPLYIKNKDNGFTEAQVGYYGWIPFLCAAIGGIGSGMFSDRLVRRGVLSMKARKLTLTGMAVFMPLFAFTPHFAGQPAAVIALFSLGAAISLSWCFNVPVIITDAFPSRNVSGVLGLSAGCGALGSMLFNLFVAAHLKVANPALVFAVMGALHLLASLILWTMTRKETPAAAATAEIKN